MKINNWSIKVKNYRNIIKLTPNNSCAQYNGFNTNINQREDLVCFYPNKLNLIVGDNNIGKTNLLKAISKLSLTTTQEKNSKLYEESRDKPLGEFATKTNDSNWRFEIHFDLPDDWAKNEIINSGQFKNDEINNCLSELKEIKNYYVAFYGEFNQQTSLEHIPEFLKKQSTIYSTHKNYFEKEFNDKIKQVFYPEFYELVDDDDVKIEKINFKKGDLDAKGAIYDKLCRLIKAFAKKDDFEKILDYLNKLKSPRVDKTDEESLQSIRDINEMKDFINTSFKEKICEIFDKFSAILHAKLEIILDDNYNIWPRISSNTGIRAETLDNQGKGIKKLIKLIYLINICCTNTDKNYVILIDEIENYLSINSQEILLSYLKSILKANSNLYVICVTHSPIFFVKNENEKWDDYLNVICCFLDNQDGMLCRNIDNLDDAINTGITISDSQSSSDKLLPDAISVLSYILNSSEKIVKKLFNGID